jgi:hypothetical protein
VDERGKDEKNIAAKEFSKLARTSRAPAKATFVVDPSGSQRSAL